MAEIIIDRTWVWLLDDASVEWELRGAGRAPDRTLRRCDPRDEKSVRRYFVRHGPFMAGRKQTLEVRGYRFKANESRRLWAVDAQRQLSLSYSVSLAID